jgi:ABC-type dipeptide/oligopeptide/nickel transport system permease component
MKLKRIQERCLKESPKQRISIETIHEILQEFFDIKERIKDENALKKYFTESNDPLAVKLKNKLPTFKTVHSCLQIVWILIILLMTVTSVIGIFIGNFFRFNIESETQMMIAVISYIGLGGSLFFVVYIFIHFILRKFLKTEQTWIELLVWKNKLE